MALLGAIEAGGTKFVVAVAEVENPDVVVARESFPTLDAKLEQIKKRSGI